MNLFIHHRDLRFIDNTTLIQQMKKETNIIPIFIFDPNQIDKKKNKYFSDNLVQFMVESLKELDLDYKNKKSSLYTFKGNYLEILKSINDKNKINSIGFNVDYSPYAKERDALIIKFCDENNIKVYSFEDMLLHDIQDDETLNKNNEAYKVFTPFKKNLINKKIKNIDKFNKFNFIKSNILKKNKYYFTNYESLYILNKNLLVEGGRNWALNRIKKLENYTQYDKCRNFMTYETTLLSASINFNVISIRELYFTIREKFKLSHGLINELYWRDFYYNILNFYPHITKGAFNEKYNKIKWSKAKVNFKKWCNGQTGFPIVDACMRQMNTTGYMHNRGRMIVSSFLVKNLWINWRWGEQYFSNKLTDYNISANNGGWQWSAGCGTDAQPYFRIFNAWTQAKDYDKECQYIKKWIPELNKVSNKDILNWDKMYDKYEIDYPSPIVDHKKTRERALLFFKKYLI